MDISLPENLNPQWVSGFVAGDGGFSIYIRPAKDYVLSEKVSCRFHIAQHVKDLELMKLFIKFFDCGSVGVRSNTTTPRCDFYVQDSTLIIEKILPHFDAYPLLNLKQEDYICFFFNKYFFFVFFSSYEVGGVLIKDLLPSLLLFLHFIINEVSVGCA